MWFQSYLCSMGHAADTCYVYPIAKTESKMDFLAPRIDGVNK